MDADTVDTLIALIEERPPIWDRRDKGHNKRTVVEKCWKEIGKIIQIDVNTLRKKWKYLRDQFCVELGKVQTSPSGVSKWRHYQALEFLTQTVIPRVYDKEDDESSSDYFDISETKRKVQSIQKESKNNKKKKIDTKIYNNFDTNIEQPSEAGNDGAPEKTVLEDEHLHFFKSLLPHVRRIPESQVLSFRSRIQKLVEESVYAPDQPSTTFVPEFSIKVSPQRYSPGACDPIDTS